jgi:hypothetical protein
MHAAAEEEGAMPSPAASVFSAVLWSATIAHADPFVLFNTFGPGGTFNLSGGHTVLADATGLTQFRGRIDTANGFQVSSGSRLDSVQLALSLVPQSTFFPERTQFVSVGQSADVLLLSDAGGAPGSVLESFHLNSVADTPAVYTLASHSQPMLLGGSRYWLAVSTGPEPTLITWHSAGQPISGLVGQQIDEGPWRVVNLFGPNGVDAFRVFGVADTSPTPEPSTLLLVFSALLGIRHRWMARSS